ncbi:MAG: DASS family sodium-coupled anion symporter [Candidatus Thermoplasmatota archaeon]
MGQKLPGNPLKSIIWKHKRRLGIIIIGIILFTIAYLDILGILEPLGLNQDMRAAFGILLLAATLWITEAIPLYATSLIIVLSQILFISDRVVPEGDSLAAEALAPFFSPIIALFLGGFVLAAGLHKYDIDVKIAKEMLRRAGKSPKNVMLALMSVTAFLSMWMSNTATTALMVALAVPIYTQIPEEEKFKKAIILGIPFAANVGGMGTPIGTPPNAIIMEELSGAGFSLTFLDWMILALPLTLIMLLFIFILLYLAFKPSLDVLDIDFDERKTTEGLSKIQQFVVAIFAITVALWLLSSWEPIGDLFQHSGIIALIPAIAFFASGILDKDDLADLNWNVLLLMGGGLSLGNAMSLTELDETIVELIPYEAMGLVIVILVFAAIGIILSTFMSNTATAAMMAPIMIGIGMDLNSEISVMVSVALACSMAMALPVSTPPNAIAYGTDIIDIKDMIKYGSLISVVGVIILTIIFGYGLYYY